MSDFSESEFFGTGVAKLLFWTHGIKGISVMEPHAHPFWQMELIVKESSFLEFSGRKKELCPGDVLLIPPGGMHKIIHGNPLRDTWSLKFEVNLTVKNSSPIVLDSETPAGCLGHLLLQSLSADAEFLKNKARVAEYLLASIVNAQLNDKLPERIEPPLAARLRSLVEKKDGGKLEVTEAARWFGYSRGHLNTIFKKNVGVSAKAFIDNIRFDMAQKYLLYAELNISEIAERMEFSDLFAFSRFFKRMSGKSPRDFLKEQREY